MAMSAENRSKYTALPSPEMAMSPYVWDVKPHRNKTNPMQAFQQTYLLNHFETKLRKNDVDCIGFKQGTKEISFNKVLEFCSFDTTLKVQTRWNRKAIAQ